MSTAPCVQYHLTFAAHAQNLVDIAVHLPHSAFVAADDGAGFVLDVAMPVWTPGSYMVREFARNVQDVRASVAPASAAAANAQSQPLQVDKINKHTWRIYAALAIDVRLQYRLWGRELTVRSNCIEQDFALLQGAATYLSPPTGSAWPHKVCLHLPDAYRTAVCGLAPCPAAEGCDIAFEAQNFDELVDTPIALGCPDLQHFEVQGVPHTLATFGGTGLFDTAPAARDFSTLAHHAADLFRTVPYNRYVMINLLYGGQGGLEHRHSAVIMASPFAMRSKASYRDFLGLVAHEHFHAWNIKRLRPKALGPFDYSQENHTHSLWVAEGITAFYDNLLVARAGLCDAKAYLAALNADVARLMATPGRLKQSLSESSFDAWIKFYRRDENSDNTTVSYYLKGSLVAALLNAALLRHSNNTVCLDDVMRLAYARHSGAHGFAEAQFRQCAYDVCEALPKDFFHRTVDTAQELDLALLYDTFGIAQAPEAQASAGGPPDGDTPQVEVGLQLKDVQGRLMVAQVVALGAASAAGVQPDDELVAIDDRRMSQVVFGHWLLQARPQKAVQLLVCRYGALRTLTLSPHAPRAPHRGLLWQAAPTDAQRAARAMWLQQTPWGATSAAQDGAARAGGSASPSGGG